MPLDVALRKLLHPELEELTADDFKTRQLRWILILKMKKSRNLI